MRRQPFTWNTLLTKLGLQNKTFRLDKRSSGRRLRFEACEDRRLLAVITVDSNQDLINLGDNVATLREAIEEANIDDSPDRILFSTDLNDLPDGVHIELDKNLGALLITEAVTIDASMLDQKPIIDADGDVDGVVGTGDGSRVFNVEILDLSFQVSNPAAVEFIGLTLTGGDVGGNNPEDGGGAIRLSITTEAKDSSFSLRNTIIENNSSVLRGGAVDATLATSGGGIHDIEITNSTIQNNQTQGDGGGLWLVAGTGEVRIDGTVVTGNTIAGSSGNGGGLFALQGEYICNSGILPSLNLAA